MPLREPSVTELDKWAERLFDTAEEASRRYKNEAGLISQLEPLIREALVALYGFDQGAFQVEHDTLPAGGGYSPADRIYGSVLVEYEWKMGPGRRSHGADQALTYLSNLEKTTGNINAYTAVVTDGRQWGFIVDRPDTQPSLFAAERQPDEYFEWRENSAGACRRFLQLCATYQQTPVSGRAVAAAFGPAEEAVGQFVTMMATVLEGRSPGDRIDTLLREWSRSTEVVYGSLDSLDSDLAGQLRNEFDIPSHLCDQFTELLFVVHSYFAFVARLVAVETLAIGWNEPESQPSHWASLSDIELKSRIERLDAGEVPTGISTIQNLFESDVFSWWVDHLDLGLLRVARPVLDILGQFAFPTVAFGVIAPTDLLRELYLRLIPRELRGQLGEFPTPTWLAEASLERMAKVGAPIADGRVLDPCCGTGAFLLPLLQRRVTRLRLEKGEKVTSEDVQQALDCVAGMDINPIAVTATRANMLVTLGSLAEVGGFRIPVWRTDSIIVPDPAPSQGSLIEPRLANGRFLELRTSAPEAFPVPVEMANADGVAAIRTALDDALMEGDRDVGSVVFHTQLANVFGTVGTQAVTDDETVWSDIRDVLDVLYDRVRDLADAGRDGVWAKIIENSFAPLFVGRFDAVVGNPPWLGWPKLPERWRTDAETLWKRYGLWEIPLSAGETRRHRAQFNDIATLAFATALERYVVDDGWVGFLTPEALTIADPGARAFRKFRLRTDKSMAHDSPIDVHFSIEHCDNWGQVKPFGSEAANRPVFLIARRGKQHTFPVPTVRWARSHAGSSLAPDWRVAKSQLTPTLGESVPADPTASFAAWSFTEPGVPLIAGGHNTWSFGMGVNTRGAAGVFHVNVDRSDHSAGTVRIRNRPRDGRNPDVVEQVGDSESALIYPFFRGRDIRPWVAEPSGHMVVTQDPTDLTSLLGEKELARRFPKALRWLRRHRTVLQTRSVPNAGWDIAGRDWYRLEGPWGHLGSGYLVVLPEQALPPPAAVVSANHMDFDLGRRAMPIPNHKVVFCAVPSFDEAAYLAAIINSAPMQQFLTSYGSSTAISPTTLSRLAIPPYTPDEEQLRVAEIARSIIESPKPADTHAKVAVELDRIVAQLLDVATT